MLFSSFQLAHPLWLLVLPLPVLVFWLVPAYRTRQSAIRVPFFDTLITALDETPTEGAAQLTARAWQRLFLSLSWILIVIALAKPTILGDVQTRERLGRDVMVVLDLSGSMAEADFTSDNGDTVTRLAAAKRVLAEFAAGREGDRLGLILFGDAAFVQAPFTADQSAWLALLDETDVAMAGQSTNLGDALGLAIKAFIDTDKLDAEAAVREKVVIALTDGNDTGSFVEPIDAAKVAAAKGVRIYTIAMGDPRTVGEQALDMEVIEQIATLSGGQFYQALDQAQLQQAYDSVSELEPKLYESTTYRPKESAHHYPMMMVLCLYLLGFTFSALRRKQKTGRSQRGSVDV